VSELAVPQLDLAAQYRAIAHEIEPVVLEVLRSQRYVLGDYVRSASPRDRTRC